MKWDAAYGTKGRWMADPEGSRIAAAGRRFDFAQDALFLCLQGPGACAGARTRLLSLICECSAWVFAKRPDKGVRARPRREATDGLPSIDFSSLNKLPAHIWGCFQERVTNERKTGEEREKNESRFPPESACFPVSDPHIWESLSTSFMDCGRQRLNRFRTCAIMYLQL
jgi:hypothetical protein